MLEGIVENCLLIKKMYQEVNTIKTLRSLRSEEKFSKWSNLKIAFLANLTLTKLFFHASNRELNVT